MIKIGEFLKKVFFQVRGFFPASLPLGANAFDLFCKKVLIGYGLPDEPSYRHAIGTMILHLGPTTSTKAPYYFAASVRKAMANQVAFDAISRIKEEEKNKEATTLEPTESVPLEETKTI